MCSLPTLQPRMGRDMGAMVEAGSAPEPGLCDLCTPTDVVLENSLAYARTDSHGQSRGHVLVIPKRHVASFFSMSPEEQHAVLHLLVEAQRQTHSSLAPDGYNIGVNVGAAAGQSRMHVHVHLIPRYVGDVPSPAGGIRCVLPASGRTGSQEPRT